MTAPPPDHPSDPPHGAAPEPASPTPTAPAAGTPRAHTPPPQAGAAWFGDVLKLALDVGMAERVASLPFTPPTAAQLQGAISEIEIGQPLGRGGMGAVYAGVQRSTGRRVAVKLLPPHRSADTQFVDRFMREAEALEKLDHPGVVRLLGAGKAGSSLYLVMEQAEGKTLRTVIREGNPAPLDSWEAVRLVGLLADTLHAAHAQGVVHRDLKPENVVVDPDGRPKVLDFGIAKLRSGSAVRGDLSAFALTEVNIRMGTPAYMAPEQMTDAGGVGPAADVYSLGVILYELLTGDLPAVDYTPPSRRGGKARRIDPRLDTVVGRCLKERPVERWGSAAELRDALRRIETTPHEARNRRLAAAAAALAVCAGVWFARVPLGLAAPAAPKVGGFPVAVAPFSAQEAREHQERWAAHLGVPIEWTNSIGMKFVLVPPGEYTMGWRPQDLESLQRGTDDRYGLNNGSVARAHRVRITKPLYFGVTEVTQRQYEQVTGRNPSYWASTGGGAYAIRESTANAPVEAVSYDDVAAYGQALSKREGMNPSNGYRLPAEAEWEYAARAGSQARYAWGERFEHALDFAHAVVRYQRPSSVGGRKPNGFGLYDCAGNVWEMCSDRLNADLPPGQQPTPEGVAVDPAAPSDTGGHILRGGWYRGDAHEISPAYRAGSAVNNMTGFRLVVPAEAVKATLAAPKSGR